MRLCKACGYRHFETEGDRELWFNGVLELVCRYCRDWFRRGGTPL